jgi:CII-binding regulator of phage lambda lysogenization HflD
MPRGANNATLCHQKSCTEGVHTIKQRENLEAELHEMKDKLQEQEKKQEAQRLKYEASIKELKRKLDAATK